MKNYSNYSRHKTKCLFLNNNYFALSYSFTVIIVKYCFNTRYIVNVSSGM